MLARPRVFRRRVSEQDISAQSMVEPAAVAVFIKLARPLCGALFYHPFSDVIDRLLARVVICAEIITCQPFIGLRVDKVCGDQVTVAE